MAQMTMPKLSDTMEEGTILEWLVEEGAEVEKGAPLVEIETDKANMIVEAPETGTLTQLAAEGDTLDVGEPIAEIGEGGGGSASKAEAREEPEEAPAEEEPEPEPEEDTEPEPEEEPAEEEAQEQEEDGRTEIPTADDGTPSEIGAELDAEEMYPGARAADAAEAEEDEPEEVPAEEEPAAEEEPEDEPAPKRAAPSDGANGGRVKASPLARRLARELGVDLAVVKGTGPDGRIVRADVEAAERGEDEKASDEKADRKPASKRAAPAEKEEGQEVEPEREPAAGERVPLSRLQRTVASRMAKSMREAPQFTLQRDVDAAEALALRRQLVEGAPEGEGPSLNDLIVKAVATAAAEHPEAVSRYDDDSLVRPEGIHVGIAVAVERGLLVPVIRDADRKSVGQIAAEARDLAARCRDGSITPRELEGSVISVSNLGMFGIDRFTAIINPPESAILAVGRATARAVVRDGEVVVREQMTLTLSIDHRALYGAEGARFLGRIAELLERPGALVL